MKKTFALLALPLLAACATVPDGSVPQLAATNWAFTSIDGAPPIADRAVMEFSADRLSANVGCNGMDGTWRLEGDRLVGGPYMSTKMFCEGVMAQEGAVAALLEADPIVEVNGQTMTLTGSGHSAELRRTN